MASIFTKIIQGEIPCYKVWENESCFAFLDINPNSLGHTLCVPKREVDKLFDLTKEEYGELMSFSYEVAKAIEKVVDCKRVGMAVVGLDVAHAHIHLIPIKEAQDMTFMKKTKVSEEEFVKVSKKIREELEKGK